MVPRQTKRLVSLAVYLLVWSGGRSSINIHVATAFTSTPFGMIRPLLASDTAPFSQSVPPLTMTGNGEDAALGTFREAEVLGLKLMQQRKYEDALKAFQTGMKLPGSRTDIIRTKTLSISPVGGGLGGLESKVSVTLDEFELQAVYYNMACAYAQLNQTDQAVESLQSAFENGFENFATVKQDPDLDPVKGTPSYDALMDKYDSKTKGFNPFGLFGGK